MLISVNEPLANAFPPGDVEVVIQRVDEAEVDAMWSFVSKKKEQRWLWHAIDHVRGRVLVYVFGRRTDEVFLKLKALLEPFGITRYHTDYWSAYTRHLDVTEHNPRQAAYTADRAQTFNPADPDQAFDAQDDLLFPIDRAA